jgi:hypothetical protein
MSRMISRLAAQSSRSRLSRTLAEKSSRRPISRVRSRSAAAASASASRRSSSWATRAPRSATRGSNSVRSMTPSACPSISRLMPRRRAPMRRSTSPTSACPPDRRRRPSAVLVGHPPGLLQDGLDLRPYGALEPIAAHRAIGADRRDIEPVAVAADAAVGAVPEGARAVVFARAGRRLAGVGVAAAPAHDQAPGAAIPAPAAARACAAGSPPATRARPLRPRGRRWPAPARAPSPRAGPARGWSGGEERDDG